MNTNPEWKLVPVEPTSEMWAAVNKLDDQMAAGGYDGKGASIEQAWNCLVETAPEAPPLTVVLDPDPRGVSVGVYQGPRCVYNGAHPIPTGATGEEQDERLFDDEAHVLVPIGLLGAACSAIDKKRDAPKTLATLRRYTTGDLSSRHVPAPAAGDALDERQDWMACDMRHRMVTDNLKLSAVEMRAREKRCRNAYTLEYMGAPMRWLADVYAEASAVFEAKLAALAAIAQQKGEA